MANNVIKSLEQAPLANMVRDLGTAIAEAAVRDGQNCDKDRQASRRQGPAD